MKNQDVQKIDEALSLLNEAAHSQKDEMSKLISSKYGNLKSTLQDLEEKASDKTHESADRLRELREAAALHAHEAAETVDRKAHEDPWKTLGWSVIGAFAIGLLLGRKD
ncbi:MAG: hypothetical protein PF795_11630 [Kiritimatiellae bacterium]|nr:hypothetical protein [Kiritimatiellia bacterium]